MEVVSHLEVFKGFNTNVYVDDIITDSGKQTRREVVVRPDAVVILPVWQGEHIWVVRQFRYPMRKELIELPAGKLDPGEDPLECAQRELAEEIGQVGTTWIPLGEWYQSPGYSTEKMYGFAAFDLTECAKPEADDSGDIQAFLMPFSEAEVRLEDAKSLAAFSRFRGLYRKMEEALVRRR